MATRIIARDNTDPFNLEQSTTSSSTKTPTTGSEQSRSKPTPNLTASSSALTSSSSVASIVASSFSRSASPPDASSSNSPSAVTSQSRAYSENSSPTKTTPFVGHDMESKIRLLQRQYGLGAGTRRHDVGALVARQQDDMRNMGLNELRMFLRMRAVQRPVVPDDWDAVELSNAQVHRACVDAYLVYELGSDLVNPILKK